MRASSISRAASVPSNTSRVLFVAESSFNKRGRYSARCSSPTHWIAVNLIAGSGSSSRFGNQPAGFGPARFPQDQEGPQPMSRLRIAREVDQVREFQRPLQALPGCLLEERIIRLELP